MEQKIELKVGDVVIYDVFVAEVMEVLSNNNYIVKASETYYEGTGVINNKTISYFVNIADLRPATDSIKKVYEEKKKKLDLFKVTVTEHVETEEDDNYSVYDVYWIHAKSELDACNKVRYKYHFKDQFYDRMNVYYYFKAARIVKNESRDVTSSDIIKKEK